MHFFDFDIIRQPILANEVASVNSSEAELLVIYLGGEDRKQFLFNVLKAAGYTDPDVEVVLVALEPDTPFDLSTLLLRQSKKTQKIMIFGLQPKVLGLHFNLGKYFPAEVNGYTFLLADDLLTIRDEKAAGSAQKAGALWKSVKAAYLKTPTN